MSGRQRDYSSIQVTPRYKDSLKRKKKPGESYEDMLKRRGIR